MHRRFTGIIPPMVTPLRDRDELDFDGLHRLIEHMLAGGVSGLFLLGTTGEGPNLSYRLRHQLVEVVCETVGSRVPILVAVTDTALGESLELAERSHAAGASAIVAASPYYFPLTQDELETHFLRLAERSPLPIMLYNMPACTKGMLPLESLRRFAEVPNIVGVKDSSGDLEYFSHLIALEEVRPDWSILMGPELLLADAMRLGGDGGICGGANLHPRLFVEWYNALLADDSVQAEECHERAKHLAKIYEIAGDLSKYVRGTKFGVQALGLCSGRMTEPFADSTASEREHIREVVAALEIPIDASVRG